MDEFRAELRADVAFPSRASRLAGGLLLFSALALAACDPAPVASEATDVEPTLSSTFDSPEAVARAVLEALAKEDVEALMSLPLSKEEFHLYVWPKLPASNPERGVPFEYAWGDLSQKSRNAIASSYAHYKGRKLELLSLTFQDGETDYGGFIVHRKSELRVRDAGSGEELELELFGSILEWKGKYKLFSYVTD
jgi:hypothetical protein